MSREYCINLELDQKLSLKMFLIFFRNVYSGGFKRVNCWNKSLGKSVALPEDYNEALKTFKHGYDESYFGIGCLGTIGKNAGALVCFYAGKSEAGLTLCEMDLGKRRNHSYDREELFEEYDFRWHLKKLLEITNPYPIKRIWVEDDVDGPEGVTHSTSFVVEGEAIYSWSYLEDRVETRTAYNKGTLLSTLERITANAIAYGAELDNFYFEELVNKPFPQEFTINTKHGSFIVRLGLGRLMSIKPATTDQDISDIRPYVEILTCLTRGLGLENFRLYAAPQKAIAL